MTLAAVGHAYAVSGKRGKAVQVIDELCDLSRRRYVSPLHVATIYAGLEDSDQAFRWLQRAYEEQDAGLVHLRCEPMLRNLRSDRRFADLLTKIGLGDGTEAQGHP